jgi:hypothetical protein
MQYSGAGVGKLIHQKNQKQKYYPAQKSVIFHSGPDSIAMHSFTTQWCLSQSSKMMMNALLVHHI